MHKAAAEAILSGKKTIETRFSRHKIAPFGQVCAGDVVYMKLPGEEVIGQFRVKKVFFYDGLEQTDVREIFEKFGGKISMGDKNEDRRYLQSKLDSRFGTLIFIADSERFITSPIKLQKHDQRGWILLGH